MAICAECGAEMLTADGCTVATLDFGGGVPDQPRIPYGQENYRGVTTAGTTERCHDCAALPGAFHHPGCDVEQCPICHGQAISCECP